MEEWVGWFKDEESHWRGVEVEEVSDISDWIGGRKRKRVNGRVSPSVSVEIRKQRAGRKMRRKHKERAKKKSSERGRKEGRQW